MGYIKHRFIDGTFFEILDGTTTYGVNAIALCCNGEVMDKTDLDGNRWFYRSDGSYSFHVAMGGIKQTYTGNNSQTNPWGLRLSYFNSSINKFTYSSGLFDYASYTDIVPVRGYGIYTGTAPLIVPRPALAYFSDSVANFGGTAISQEEWEQVFPLSTGISSEIPITYIPINSTLYGPAQAADGDEVEVDVSFPDGYKLKDVTQGSGISVYYDNGYIDFTYDEATRKLRFIMPT